MKTTITFFIAGFLAYTTVNAQENKLIQNIGSGKTNITGAMSTKNKFKSKGFTIKYNAKTANPQKIKSTMQIQTCFDTGTGTDGAYSATTNTTIVGGTYNFTSFNIDAGVLVTVTGNNPLIINCTGLATINGSLTADGGNGTDGITSISGGTGGIGVAGGSNGGDGTYSSSVGPLDGQSGNGTGGANTQGSGWSGAGGAGYDTTGASSGGVGGLGGPQYGNHNLNPFVSGSGGGGGSGGFSCGSGGGGAGGGIIKMNADTLIIGASGLVSSNGGNGGSDGTGNCGGGGGGSGGSILLGAIHMTLNGGVSALGGLGGSSAVGGSPYYGTGGNGSIGRIRLDYNGILSGTGTLSPAAGYTVNIDSSKVKITGGTQVCTGNSITLTGSGVTTYTWNTGPNTNTITVSPTVNTTYTLNGTNSVGCFSMDTFMVQVQPLPTITVTATTATVCIGSADTLSALGASTYTWSANAGSATTMSLTISPTSNDTYTVTGTDANGCVNTNTVVVNVQTCTTGLQQLSNYKNKIYVYPNPGNGIFYLESDKELGTVEIYNSIGELVYKAIGVDSKVYIDLSENATGIYYLNTQGKSIKISKQ